MDVKKLRGDVVRINAIFDVYDELHSSGTFEFKVAREQLLNALLETKKDLKAMEAELQNEG